VGGTHDNLRTASYRPVIKTEPTRQEADMALFMDIHKVDGTIDIDGVTEAHTKDLATQDNYGVTYLRYWVDESNGRIFCLVEADTADDAVSVHREAHGGVADEIFPVSEHR